MNEIDPRLPSRGAPLLETAALCGLSVAALLSFGASPWLALAPLLAGARFGAIHGFACGLGPTLAVAAGAPVPDPSLGGAAALCLGWLVAGTVPGAFRDSWVRRAKALEASNAQLGKSLDRLARGYHALRVSHERLQQRVPGQPNSLRDALRALRSTLLEAPRGSQEAVARRILDFFRDHAGVHGATWHPVEGSRPQPAIAVLGSSEGGSEEDEAIRRAAETGEVISVRDLSPSAAIDGGTLVAVPLVDVEGAVHAVIAVRELPFVALHEDALRLLAVLGGHAGDLLSAVRAQPEDGALRPREAFCAGISRAMRDAGAHGVPSSLVTLAFRAERSMAPADRDALRAVARQVAARRRSTDLAEILIDAHGTPRVFLLLRLAGAEGLAACGKRVEQLARDRLAAAGLRCEVEVTGCLLDRSPFPSRPRQIERFLLSLLNDVAPASIELSGRSHHDRVA